MSLRSSPKDWWTRIQSTVSGSVRLLAARRRPPWSRSLPGTSPRSSPGPPAGLARGGSGPVRARGSRQPGSSRLAERPYLVSPAEPPCGPGSMFRAAGSAAAARMALVEGEDDALVDVAAFQLPVGLGGLLHGYGLARPQAEPAVGQQGDCLIQSTGGTVGRGLRQRDAEVSGGWVGQGDDPLGAASQGDRVGQDTVAGRVEHGVD